MENVVALFSRVGNLLRSKHTLLLLFIIFLAIFFRSYQLIERFEFAHDGDLYSWIVKDIVVNKHIRLIGQQTSTEGIFIGPFFYYLLIPFFLLTSLDPIGVLILPILIGVATVLTYYFVFRRFFGLNYGIIASFLQAILLTRVNYDRWVVPTITVNLWAVWYLYTILMLSKGNFYVFPLLGFLIGLIWHINLSLMPVLIVAPVAIFLSGKRPKLGEFIKGFVAMAVPLVPFVLFESRHNFVQTISFFRSFFVDQGGGRGMDKLYHVLQQVVGNSVGLFFYPNREIFIGGKFFLLIILVFTAIVFIYKKLDKKPLVLLYIWIFSVIFFFTFSNKITSEYYFSIIDTAILACVTFIISFLFQLSKKMKVFTVILLTVLLIRNFLIIIGENGYSYKGYLERKETVSFIVKDAKEKGFPCISVSYIASPGEDFGFRYMFFLKKLHVNQPKSGSPVYTIVSPADLASDSIDKGFGALGIILPEKEYNPEEVSKTCSGENSNLTDPLFGYTE